MSRLAELYQAFEALEIYNEDGREQEEGEVSLSEARQIEPVGSVSDEFDEAAFGPNDHEDKENVLGTPTQPIVLPPRITLAPMKPRKRHLRVRFDPLDMLAPPQSSVQSPVQQKAEVVRHISFRAV